MHPAQKTRNPPFYQAEDHTSIPLCSPADKKKEEEEEEEEEEEVLLLPKVI
ncbi:hypothetical protein BDN67DRAFT_1011123 [Paxillus ammoniavirescens]|nr:hypothetical protein BDN67DRAFT_1011123 [Paxillus ammoniavirescens]